MIEKKYHLKCEFSKMERKGFIVQSTLDKVLSRDDVSIEMEKFTRGYHENDKWFGLKVSLEEAKRE